MTKNRFGGGDYDPWAHWVHEDACDCEECNCYVPLGDENQNLKASDEMWKKDRP